MRTLTISYVMCMVIYHVCECMYLKRCVCCMGYIFHLANEWSEKNLVRWRGPSHLSGWIFLFVSSSIEYRLQCEMEIWMLTTENHWKATLSLWLIPKQRRISRSTNALRTWFFPRAFSFLLFNLLSMLCQKGKDILVLYTTLTIHLPKKCTRFN